MGKTLFDKIWQSHLVQPESDAAPGVLYIDLHLIHEVTSPQAFSVLRERGLRVRRTDRTLATLDHSTPTLAADLYGVLKPGPATTQIQTLEKNCADFDVPLFDLKSSERGIVHVIGPELGASHPGYTIVCGDSHTSTHGAFGALAFGIGTTEVGHVLATQCLLQRRPKTMAVNVSGTLAEGVSAKDLILAIVGKLGVGGGTGHVLEYRGEAITALSMEQRMTVCNMSIEAGARAGLIAPDDTTFDYLHGRRFSPSGAAWDEALIDWRGLHTDSDAKFDASIDIDASALTPMITFGTNPGMVMPIDGAVPEASAQALKYMGLSSGEPMLGKPVDVVFVGSCTNSRLSDLRDAAAVFRGRKVKDGVRTLIVPGSQDVKRQAEAEGLHEVFLSAGAEWRESGCSMCIAMNGDSVGAGQYSVSTSNRNFEGRQGSGARTLLASPMTAAAAAVTGQVSDPRQFLS
ncbi:MAG: 3-isopropylmalate dehydratase large subunit [Gammaproteobacteria bacterium]